MNLIAIIINIISAMIAVSAPVADNICYASWYGNEFHGNYTANGEVYDQWGYSAASAYYPMGTQLRVCSEEKCVQLKVNDTGLFEYPHCLDLSRGAFNALADESKGIINVEVYILK